MADSSRVGSAKVEGTQSEVRARGAQAPSARPVQAERAAAPRESVALSAQARRELGEAPEAESPEAAGDGPDRYEPGGERPQAGSAEQLRVELAKPSDQRDWDRIQQLIARTQGELDGGRPAASGSEADSYRAGAPQPLEGYDAGKLDDPSVQTPKYLFGRVARNFDLSSVKGDKSKAEALLNAMVPELKAAGLEVVGVEGDRIQVKTEVGYEWVDVIRGAGGDDPGWWWGSEAKGTEQPTASSKEWAAQTGQAGGSGGGSAPAGGGSAAAPGAGAAGPQGPAILGSQIDSGKVMSILEKHPPTNEGIRAALPELQQAFPGVQILDHPKRLDKLQFANGAVVDVIVGSGGPNPKWGWMPEN